MRITIETLTINDRGARVAELHERLVKLGYTIPRNESDAQLFGIGTQNALRQFQKKHKVRRSGILDDRTEASLMRAVAVVESGKNRIEGRIYCDDGSVAPGLKLMFYSRGFGGTAKKFGETTTDDQGFYACAFDPQATVHNVEVRCLDAQGKELALSETKHDLDQHEVLYLVAPSDVRTLAPEYDRLTAALTKEIRDLSKLGQARETAERRDLTLLHKATGWDARLIALAATAVKLSAETKIPTDFFYALFRVGLPTDKHLLCTVSESALDKAIAKAMEAGIVDIDRKHMALAKCSFDKFAQKARRAVRAPGTRFTFGEMLAKSGLTAAEQETFEALYFSHRGSGADLWKQAEEHGISKDSVEKLRLQGKLAVLTYNNLPLVESLQTEINSPENLARLVDLDLDKAETWKEQIKAITGEDEAALAQFIPPAYVGENTADRLKIYAADLARKVRLSFRTDVVRRMVERDELHLGGADTVMKQSVATFLRNATSRGFQLGSVPVRTFVARHGDQLFQGIAPENIEVTIQQLRRLHRLYQITPSDESLKVLDELGFSWADEVAQISVKDFCEHHGWRFPSPREAALVGWKSRQVSGVTHAMVTTALQTNSSPGIFAISGSEAQRKEAHFHLREQLKDYPTMESLFGSLDFCECEHCRSVLSPAAYLVDLFQFLDPDDTQWDHKRESWAERHGGNTYPYDRPFDVLIERRPDLPHLPLTCENTHTALPYIDVLNEILEYSVAYGALPETSYDTGEATTEELLAEPHNILPLAYNILKDPDQASHPLILPFDLWLETVRALLNHFDTSLWQILEAFRTNEELFTSDHQPYSRTEPSDYYQAAVFLEYLGISPAEYEVFTRQRPADWEGLYGAVDGELKCGKTLARQLDVTYKQLVDIVQTGFVNPELERLALIWKYGFGPSDALWYLEDREDSEHAAEAQAFVDRIRKRIAETIDESEVEAQVDNVLSYLEDLQSDGCFERALVLRDTSGLCNFDQTFLEYAAPADSTPDSTVFVKINLFVRLWKKLGWTIEETDHALQVFLPGGSAGITSANIDDAFRTALVYLAHLKALDEKVDAGRDSRLKLLALWADLPTIGRHSLYAKLFLSPGVQKLDPIFDDPLGNYLCTGEGEPFTWDPEQPEDRSDGNVPLKKHLLGLQAALQLTADEVGQILADAGTDLESAALNLANCSLLYRYKLLADALHLSVPDLIALKGLSGLNPFRPLSRDPLEELEFDFPLTQTLGFVEIAQTVKDSGFKVEDLDYLLCHRFDPVGKYRDDSNTLLALLKPLAGELHRIREEHAVPADPATFGDDHLCQKLALVLPVEVAERFFAMWTGTVEYQAIQIGVSPDDQLDSARFADEDAIRVSYDAVREEQRLVYCGVLLHEDRVLLEDRLRWIAGDSFWASRFGELLDSVQEQARDFFNANLVMTVLDEQYSFGFLEPGDFELLFSPSRDLEKRARLAQTFLPYLQRQLARQVIVQTMATNLSADPALTEALLTDTRLLRDPSQAGDPQPLLKAFEAAGERGVTATYRITGDAQEYTLGLLTADTEIHDPETDERLLPEELTDARFEGYLEVPATGAYRFFVVCERVDVRAKLRFAHLPDPLPVARDDEERPFELKSEVIELKAGIPYRFACSVSNLDGSNVALLVQGETLAKGALSRLTLYPQATVERLDRARTLLAKVWQLVQGFGLNEREVRYLLTHPEDFADLDLSGLPTSEQLDETSPEAAALFQQFMRLADYTRLREVLAAGEGLINLFERSRRAYDETVERADQITTMDEELCQILADITRRDLATVQEAAAHLGFGAVQDTANPVQLIAADFTQEHGIRRLWEILQIVERLGVTVGDVARWATPAPDAETARDLKHAVKARYEQENWLRIVRPIHDVLRRKQRDALVAFLMHRDDFESVEKLYEYFLVDPGMEPVVQTSRIQLAISSVQTFIQRCLLNLEKYVSPFMIDAKQWQWMKRYRVWEANRKIFLFPENWLEPEWRDDKTHLFRELESALLQGDVSRELVEDAFHTYLKGLETIARLDIVTMYREEDPDDHDTYTLHVIGRTFGLSPKYFYRRYSSGMWTPWEPVSANIEGDHVVAVVWRQRLHLFWVTFMPKPEQLPPSDPNETYMDRAEASVASTSPNTEVEVQLHWCEYFQGKWTTPEVGDIDRVVRATVIGTFDESKVFIHVTKEYEDGEERAVVIHLWSDDLRDINKVVFLDVPPGSEYGPQEKTAFLVKSRNSKYEIVVRKTALLRPYRISGWKNARYVGRGPLQLTFEAFEARTLDPGELINVTLPERSILGEGEDPFSLLLSSDLFDSSFSEIERVLCPLFYQDSLNTFFVEPILFEPSIDQSEEPGVLTWMPGLFLESDSWWQGFPVFSATIHEPPRPPESAEPVLIDPIAKYAFSIQNDWATDPSTGLKFDDSLVGSKGALDLQKFAIHGRNVVTGHGVNSSVISGLRVRRTQMNQP